MTFSLLGRCARTGQIGLAAAMSSLALGARVGFARAGVGAVLTQHRTDPPLGPRGLALLEGGCDAAATVAALVASTPHAGWRQLAAMDRAGRVAWFHGDRVKPARAAAEGPGVVALGNILASEAVPAAMVAAFAAAPAEPLAARLVAAMAAGEAAGGEGRPLVSACLLVVAEQSFPLVDLRIDRDAAPIAALVALWQAYAPQQDGFVRRATDPDDAPTF